MRPPAFLTTPALVLAILVGLSVPALVQTSPELTGKLERLRERAAREDAEPVSLPPQRTVFTEDELNAWLEAGGTPLPAGVHTPSLALMADGRIEGQATVDLEQVPRREAAGMLDPLSLLRGQVPVVVTGVLRADDGVARFDLERATVGGLSVPPVLLQQLLSRYSATPERPDGVRLDDAFPLPLQIDRIVVVAGRAVVVQ